MPSKKIIVGDYCICVKVSCTTGGIPNCKTVRTFNREGATSKKCKVAKTTTPCKKCSYK
tara:strand:+ start:3649 stop:3825 length:177 start_codon:yes stop_codon:yes gene_type:complete